MITFLHDKMKGLLLVLLAVVGISFIFFGSWTPHGADRATTKVGSIGGHDLTLNTFVAAQRQAMLDLTLQTGRIPSSEQNQLLMIQTWIGLLEIQAADAAQLEAEPAQLVEAIKANPLFQKEKQYDPEIFQRFSANFLSPQGFSGERFNQAVLDQVRTQKLLTTLASTSTVFPEEAESRLQLLFGPAETQVVRWDPLKMTPPEPTTQDLEIFYKGNEASFSIPPRHTVDVVEFVAAGTTEEARAKAAETAYAFTSQFFNLPEGKSRPDFQQAVAAAKLTSRTYGPFTPSDTPFVGETDPRLTAAAFALTEADPVSDYLPSKNGCLVLFLRQKTAGRSRPLAEVSAEVRSQWQLQAQRQLAAQQAKIFIDRANQGLAQGQKWDDLLKAAGLTATKIPTFAPADDKPLAFPDADRIRQVVAQLEANRLSSFIPTPSGGLAVYLAKRDPAPLALRENTLPKITTQIGNQRRGQIVRDWLTGRATLPGNQLPQEVLFQLRGTL